MNYKNYILKILKRVIKKDIIRIITVKKSILIKRIYLENLLNNKDIKREFWFLILK